MVLAPLILVAIIGQAPGAVADLIRQLGADVSTAREQAARRLGEIGEPAEAALREAVATADPETRARAGHVLDRIVRLREEREFGERLRVLGATFGDRRCGSVSMKTRIERRGERDILVFEDHVGAWCQARCEFTLDPPRIETFYWAMHDSGEVLEIVGGRKGESDDRIHIVCTDTDGDVSRACLQELPPQLCAAYEYYRLACVVGRVEGEVLHFTQFVMDWEEDQFRAAELRCIGREHVGDGDPWRIEYWREGAGTPEMTRLSTLWVTDDGELVQVQPEGGKALLVEK